MKTRIASLLALLVAVPALAACGGNSTASNSGGGKLNLVAYSTPKEAYAALIPAFNKTTDGKGVSFTQSFGPSGDQARAVQSGLPADVVALSLAPDVDKLVDAKKVAAGWGKGADQGFVTNSGVVLAGRQGNPQNNKTRGDPAKPGGPGGEPKPV